MGRAEHCTGTGITRKLQALQEEPVLRAGLRGEGQPSSGGTGNGTVAKGGDVVRAAAPRRCSQQWLECICVVGRNVSRRCSSPYLERTRRDEVGIEASVGLQRKNSRGIGYGGVAESDEGVGIAGPRRSSKGTPESLHVVRRLKDESRTKKAGKLR